MKLLTDRPLTDPDAAARKLMEMTNAVEPVHDCRIHVEKINGRPPISSRARRRSTTGRLMSLAHVSAATRRSTTN